MTHFDLKKLNQLGQALTAKETAQLVIGYILKEDEASKSYENERKTLINALSIAQARAYNFYTTLYKRVSFVQVDLGTSMIELERQSALLDKLHYMMLVDHLARNIHKTQRIFPIFISPDMYQQKLDEEKQRRLNETIEIERIAISETYYTLLKQGVINKQDYPYTESLEDALENMHKTQDELLEEYVTQHADWIRFTLAKETKNKSEEITDDEISEYIEKTVHFSQMVTPEVQRAYEQVYKEQCDRIQSLTAQGVLQKGQEDDKEGILIKSIYNNMHLFSDTWLQRYVDDIGTYEIGEYDSHGEFRRYAASVDSFYIRDSGEESLYDIELSHISDLLESMTLLKPHKINDRATTYTFKNKETLTTIQHLLANMMVVYQLIQTYSHVISRIEHDFFDDMEILGEKTIAHAQKEAKEVLIHHNTAMHALHELFKELFSTGELEEFSSFLFHQDMVPDEEKCNEMYDTIVEKTARESGYYP